MLIVVAALLWSLIGPDPLLRTYASVVVAVLFAANWAVIAEQLAAEPAKEHLCPSTVSKEVHTP